jgi:DNA-binding NarL/FixJ family response regulator
MRVLLVDNDRLLLDSLRLAFEMRRPGAQVEVAADETRALALAETIAFDLVVLDWWLGTRDALDCFNQLQERCPSARIVVMSGDDSAELVHKVLELGAAGFLRKNASDVGTLHDAIDVVTQGGIYLSHAALAKVGTGQATPPSVKPHWVGRDIGECFPQLTDRQRDVLRELLQGAKDKVIARRLDIGLTTVKTHVGEVYRRIGASCRAEAVAIAARVGVRVD